LDPAGAVAASGLAGAEGAWVAEAGGNRHVVVLTEAPIDRLAPDLNAVAAVTASAKSTTFAVARRSDDRTLHVRVFAPGAGVAEDPGTGSAAGPIGVLARRHWGLDADLTIRQGGEIGRPCTIEVHAEDGAIRVGGRIAVCAKGHFSL
jgi:trans-2,3-dihydro-3-hydroxyanthranilate isomerase